MAQSSAAAEYPSFPADRNKEKTVHWDYDQGPVVNMEGGSNVSSAQFPLSINMLDDNRSSSHRSLVGTWLAPTQDLDSDDETLAEKKSRTRLVCRNEGCPITFASLSSLYKHLKRHCKYSLYKDVQTFSCRCG